MLLAKRLGRMLVSIVGASFIVFAVLEFTPGTVASMKFDPYASAEQKEILFKTLKLGDPLIVRYGRWIGVLTGIIDDPLADPALNLRFTDPRGHQYFGNFGYSTLHKAPVNDIMWDRLGNTAMLAGIAFAIVVPLSMAFGVFAGMREGSLMDRGLSLTGLTLASFPEFVSALLLIVIFVISLGLLPGASTLEPNPEWSLASQMVLPVMVLVLSAFGHVAITVRASIIEMMARRHIQTGTLKGLPYQRIVWRYAVLVSVKAILLKIPWLIGSILVIELIFSYPGFGRMLLEAVLFGDLALLEAAAVLAVLIVVTAQFVGDVGHMYLKRVSALAEKSAPETETTDHLPLSKLARRLLGAPVAVTGASLVAFWLLVAIFAPWISEYGPNAQDFAALADPTPGGTHILGTDQLGRDILSRLVWGARAILTVALLAMVTAYFVGSLMGMVAGYVGGWVDTLISRIADILLSFPVLIFYIMLSSTLGPSALNIIVAVAVVSSPGIARIVRGQVRDLRARESVDAAKIRSERPIYIMVVELLVDAWVRMGYTILLIVLLGFLGISLPPPDPEWGSMVKDTTALFIVWPHMMVLPCIAILSLVIGINLLADGLRRTFGLSSGPGAPGAGGF